MKKIHYAVTKNYEDMSRESAQLILSVMKANPEGLYCFAGGDTPVRTLELLVKAHEENEIDLTKAYFVELDEWVGLNPENKGSCASYLNQHLFIPAGVSKEHTHFFDPLSVDLKKECDLANQFILAHEKITLSLLGVGVNGHLGFNEPGASFDDQAHVVELDEITQEVGKKYFDEEVDRTQGISLGIRQLLDSSTLIIQASGERKNQAMKKTLIGKVDKEWPVTVVWKHQNAYLIVDEDAVK